MWLVHELRLSLSKIVPYSFHSFLREILIHFTLDFMQYPPLLTPQRKGNLISVSFEKWATIRGGTHLEPRISAEEAMERLANHAGYALEEGETCERELVILTLVGDLLI